VLIPEQVDLCVPHGPNTIYYCDPGGQIVLSAKHMDVQDNASLYSSRHTQALLPRIRDTIRCIEPAARIILYGSRARGDARPDSDWDLLILLNGAVDHHRAATVRHRLYDLELESDMVLSTMVLSNAAWETPLSRAMPFYANVMREGIEV
jgi:predicted nucleotidyltransferase